MASLQVKHVPEELHERLRRVAADSRRTLSEIVLEALKRELARREWQQRLAQRPESELGVLAASLLAEERAGRDRELP
jgi:predicted transcriptional regulator